MARPRVIGPDRTPREQSLIPASAGHSRTMTTPVKLRSVLFQSLGEIPATYDPVFADGKKDDFFLSRPWFENFAATSLPRGATLAIQGLQTTGTEPRGVALLIGSEQRGEGRMPM